MIVVAVACGAMLCVGAVLSLIRLERGPSMLDRTVAFDVLTATLVAAVGVEAAWNRDVDTVPVLVALSLVGFVGSVAISRFASADPAEPVTGDDPLEGDDPVAADGPVQDDDPVQDDGPVSNEPEAGR